MSENSDDRNQRVKWTKQEEQNQESDENNDNSEGEEENIEENEIVVQLKEQLKQKTSEIASLTQILNDSLNENELLLESNKTLVKDKSYLVDQNVIMCKLIESMKEKVSELSENVKIVQSTAKSTLLPPETPNAQQSPSTSHSQLAVIQQTPLSLHTIRYIFSFSSLTDEEKARMINSILEQYKVVSDETLFGSFNDHFQEVVKDNLGQCKTKSEIALLMILSFIIQRASVVNITQNQQNDLTNDRKNNILEELEKSGLKQLIKDLFNQIVIDQEDEEDESNNVMISNHLTFLYLYVMKDEKINCKTLHKCINVIYQIIKRLFKKQIGYQSKHKHKHHKNRSQYYSYQGYYDKQSDSESEYSSEYAQFQIEEDELLDQIQLSTRLFGCLLGITGKYVDKTKDEQYGSSFSFNKQDEFIENKIDKLISFCENAGIYYSLCSSTREKALLEDLFVVIFKLICDIITSNRNYHSYIQDHSYNSVLLAPHVNDAFFNRQHQKIHKLSNSPVILTSEKVVIESLNVLQILIQGEEYRIMGNLSELYNFVPSLVQLIKYKHIDSLNEESNNNSIMIRRISQVCLNRILQYYEDKVMNILADADYSTSLILLIGTAGGIQIENDAEIYTGIQFIQSYYEHLHYQRLEKRATFQQRYNFLYELEWMENEGGSEEIDAQLWNKLVSIQQQQYQNKNALEAKKSILHRFKHRSNKQHPQAHNQYQYQGYQYGH